MLCHRFADKIQSVRIVGRVHFGRSAHLHARPVHVRVVKEESFATLEQSGLCVGGHKESVVEHFHKLAVKREHKRLRVVHEKVCRVYSGVGLNILSLVELYNVHAVAHTYKLELGFNVLENVGVSVRDQMLQTHAAQIVQVFEERVIVYGIEIVAYVLADEGTRFGRNIIKIIQIEIGCEKEVF
jgi:hypothetical protein